MVQAVHGENSNQRLTASHVDHMEAPGTVPPHLRLHLRLHVRWPEKLLLAPAVARMKVLVPALATSLLMTTSYWASLVRSCGGWNVDTRRSPHRHVCAGDISALLKSRPCDDPRLSRSKLAVVAVLCHLRVLAAGMCVAVWLCGCVAVWLCGCVAVWLCGCVASIQHVPLCVVGIVVRRFRVHG